MYMNDVIKKCEEKGYKITKAGLYQAGQKYGFLKKPDGQHSWDFDQKKFLEWLDKATEEIPEGWVTLNEASKILNVSLPQMYILVKDENSGARYIGSGKGVLYVDPKRIEEVIKNRKDKHHYIWEDENGAN